MKFIKGKVYLVNCNPKLDNKNRPNGIQKWKFLGFGKDRVGEKRIYKMYKFKNMQDDCIFEDYDENLLLYKIKEI